MLQYEYQLCKTGDAGGHAWQLTLNGRPLGRFSGLEAALASARSLQHIDCRAGAHPTVDVATEYEKFRVTWLDGAPDSVQLDRTTDLPVQPLQRALRSGSPRG